MLSVNWRKLLILSLIAIVNVNLASCNPDAPEMKNKPKLWGANSKYETLYRKNGKDEYLYVACKDPKFDEYICVLKSEYVEAEKELIEISNQCEKWK